MTAVTPTNEPAAFVAALEAKARRLTTPLGEKGLVWRVWGNGAPLVLFHGGSGSWTHWIRNIEALAAHYQVWAVDLPCFGDSDVTPNAPELGPMYDVVQLGLTQVMPGDRPFRLVSFSFGSFVAAAIAGRMPERFDRTIFVGNGLKDKTPPEIELRSWRKLADPLERREAHRYNLLKLMMADPARVDELALHVQIENTQRSRFDRQRLRMDWNLGDQVAGLKMRVGAIWGAGDAVARPVEDEAVLKAAHPDAQTAIIPAAGHWVAYEAAPVFNATLLRMLA